MLIINQNYMLITNHNYKSIHYTQYNLKFMSSCQLLKIPTAAKFQ